MSNTPFSPPPSTPSSAVPDLHNAVLEVLRELSPARKRLQELPPADTPLPSLLTDSMMVLSALLSLEEKVRGDLGRLDPNAPPPQTLGDFIQLGEVLNPDLKKSANHSNDNDNDNSKETFTS